MSQSFVAILFVLIVGSIACAPAEAAQETVPTVAVNLDCPVPDDERAYLLALAIVLDAIGQLAGGLAAHVKLTAAQPELMIDEDWEITLGDWLLALVDQSGNINDLYAPEPIIYIEHRALMLADSLDTAAIELSAGIGYRDQGRVDKGGFAFTMAEGHMAKVYDLINGYCRRAAENHPALQLPR